MLLIGLVSLLVAIPLNSSTITPTLLTRITSITLLFGAFLSFNGLYTQSIGTGLGLYSGLFHVTTVTQAIEIFLFTTGAFILTGFANRNKGLLNGGSLPVIPEYSLIILFTVMGASFLITSSDLVSMYLSIELQSFAVYILATIYRDSESATAAGLKYFLLGALSSALILLGSSLIYAYTGLTNFEGIYSLASYGLSPDGLSPNGLSPNGYGDNYTEAYFNVSQGVMLGTLIVGVGFLFKVAAAPFHNWAPDVYDGVPTIVTTWLTVMPKISIFIFLLELQTNGLENAVLNNDLNVWKNLLLATSLLSLVVGTVVGLSQYKVKRLLAYSTISHVGFLLLALSVNSEESVTGFLFYLMQYSLTNLNTFFIILALGYLISYSQNYSFKSEENRSLGDLSFIVQLKGQFHLNPVLGLSFAVCLFSIAGIPPLIGFFAKYMVLYSAIENGYYFLALTGILASVISAAYYLRIVRVIHFDQPSAEVTSSAGKKTNGFNTTVLTSVHSYIIAVLTLLIALFILSPTLFLNSSNLLALSLFTI